MKTIVNPGKEVLAAALQRPKLKPANLEALVADVFTKVNEAGDSALADFSLRFDKAILDTFEVTSDEIESAAGALSEDLKTAINRAAANIRRFHEAQATEEAVIETSPGVSCWRKSVPVQSVGLYIPGGSAPLFSTVLMLGIPAAIAGCPQRILCTPPQANGTVNPAILYAAQVAGITRVFKVGGAQAIAAMAIGTESIPKADKIFGPGNQYVTAAKQYAQRFGVAIDLPAGPSEVLVAADNTVPAAFIAADLLAQAEHGPDSQVIFLTDAADFAAEVNRETENQLKNLPRAVVAQQALENSVCIVTDPANWIGIINEYAPEHLIIAGKQEESVVNGVVNAGSVFIGPYSAESFGDYASGTNHTLPTAGYAKAWSGVSLDSFVKKITYQRISEQGLRDLGPTVMILAQAESLEAHSQAIAQRISYIQEPVK